MKNLLFFLTTLLIILNSCNHIELADEIPGDQVDVTIIFDWEGIDDAAPEEMSVHFFRTTKRSVRPYIYDFHDLNGGTIKLPPGIYSAICYNSDSDNHTLIGQNSFYDFGIRLGDYNDNGLLNQFPSLKPSIDEERIAHAPDKMWISSIESLEIGKDTNTSIVIRFKMIPIVNKYKFIIHHPINYTDAFSILGVVTGMTSTIHPGVFQTGNETVSHTFIFEKNNNGELIGELLTFGHCTNQAMKSEPSEDSELHSLRIHAVWKNGKNWVSSHDITSQIHNENNSSHIIEIDTVTFPNHSQGSEGGFNPSVGGWTGNTEFIGM
ncbi:MAG: DUF5119 domain-containing protein [Muribaculaceae bacterium]|nr:DUF5119 domain-containing protein [Muribaculaceae bacterium]